jgi:hypothetical protein
VIPIQHMNDPTIPLCLPSKLTEKHESSYLGVSAIQDVA